MNIVSIYLFLIRTGLFVIFSLKYSWSRDVARFFKNVNEKSTRKHGRHVVIRSKKEREK